MADETSEGSPGDDRPSLLCRLVFDDNDDWRLDIAKLNVLSLACDLQGTDIGRHPHDVTAFTHAKEPLFVQPGFGGMQLADASPIYPGEPYFLLTPPGREEPPVALRGTAIRQGSEKGGVTLYRGSLPKAWTPDLEAWATSAGLKVSRAARLRWQAESDLNQPEDFTSVNFSALLSSPETRLHHVSLFMGSPVEASWSVLTWIDPDSFRDAQRFIDVVCRYERRPRGELYVRVESDLDLGGDWLERDWTVTRTERRRAFIIHVGYGFAIHAQIVLPR
jgi:hypothetical protein